MKILDRYVVRSFYGTFVLLLLGLPLLFIITDLTDHLDKYLSRGLSGQAVALSYLYQLPQFIQYAFPIAALVATVFTIGNMTRHQEIAAAKAGGVSFYRIIVPLLVSAVVLSGGALALGELVPVTNRLRAEVIGERSDRHVRWRSNFVFETAEGHTLAVNRLDAGDSRMDKVVLQRESSPQGIGLHSMAEFAHWDPGEGWRFEQGRLRVLTEDEREMTFSFSSARVPALEETPEELLAEPKDPEEMRYAEMSRFIGAIERSGGDAAKLRVERAQKIALPVAVFVIVLFGAPLATSSRRGGAAYGIGISLAVTLVYLLLFKIGTGIGESGALPPLVAAWMPNAIFLVLGLGLLAKVRT